MTQHLRFLILLAVSQAVFAPVWVEWARLSLQDRRYANALLIPAISAGLIFLRRREVFLAPGYWPRLGVPLIVFGIASYTGSSALPLPVIESLGVNVFAAVLTCVGTFVLVYGKRPLAAARFPLLFLLLTIPIPPGLLDTVIAGLQRASAETAYALFQLSGETIYRDAFTFSLPGVSIEIASECSGIRSTSALFIASILVGHLFLRSGWRKLGLTASTVPVAIFTNAVRIVTMSLLAVHGSPRFLYGDLHNYSGKLFSLLSLSLLAAVLFLLHKSERGRQRRAEAETKPTLPLEKPALQEEPCR